jgi:hypothetical protein
VLAVITLAAGVLAVVAVDRGNALGDQLDLANAELLAQSSLRTAPNDPVAATQLALAGWRLDPENASVRTALLHQYMAMRSVEGVFAGSAREPILPFGTSDDGHAMLIADSRGAFVLTGLPLGPVHRQVLEGVPPDMRPMYISDDGTRVAGIAGRSRVLLWDLPAGGGPQVLSSPAGNAPIEPAIALSGDRVGWLEADSSGGNHLRIWDAAANRPAPHDGTPLPEHGVTGLALAQDGGSVLVRTGDPVQPDSRLVARRLGDGAELGTFPGGSLPLLPGDRVATCEVDASEGAQAVVRNIVGGAELRRSSLAASDCERFSEYGTAGDGNTIAERIAPPGDYDVVRITDLDDGSLFDVTVPPDSRTPTPGVGSRMAVFPGPDGTRTVLLPHGTSILRLRADPNPYAALFGSPPHLDVSDDEHTVVALYARYGAATFDAVTRLPVARLDPLAPPATASSGVDDRLSILGGTPQDGMVLSQYELPSLTPVVRAPIPRRQGEPAQAASISSAGNRLFTFADGLLAGFDRTTGAPIGPPVDLAPTQQARDWFASRARAVLAARGGGHPDEVLVLAPGSTVELWDVARGERLAALPHREGRLPIWFAPDAEGRRLLVSTQAGMQEVWDLDRQEIIGAPFPVPGFPLPIGFTADGRVITATAQRDGTVQSFWDLSTGALDGTIRLLTSHDGGLTTDAGMWVKIAGEGAGYGGPLPFRMAVTAQQWVDHLCTFSARPFTDVERASLPAGSVIAPPC